ncbi:hypothetical protein A2W13_01405 [Candidatus Woesebacteria bacterium RBG_16_36_11]|uniref:Glycosyltransferase RgtA/B/C/D-like domain-containing protein n=3 Tax=Candidatus Woeseibacteriota TaxID=1752722 RepID=A0A1F7XBE6_9BACT|nr:MAG: hypothetical protein A2Z67_03410 [Candidatus Woesebacteria bacterium RBG_13_36_22]OGM12283.1 MAG: hypothetical protein A2W13_01405 [Candidatus Woesebacteria bacterium RBG_16_36_11]OGM16299.1 MAG: hypothetical protein A2V55_01110 [Candidatus Woesebacteria bacterium RBG_19FT_COMBO_37_29]
MPNMKKLLEKFHVPNWLLILLSVVIILRIPSFFEPYAYGDEMIYLTLGEGVRQGIPLYQGLYDNKPPLLYITAAIAGRLFWFKAILALWNFGTIIIFWKLAQALFPKKESLHKIATIIFAILTTIPLLEGNIANAEIFMIGPTILAFLIIFSKKLSIKNLIFSGILFGVSALFKLPAAFELPVIFAFWLILNGLKKNELLKTIKRFAFIVLGFAIPIFLTLIWYYFRGALGDYIHAAFLQNIGYLSTWRPSTSNLPFMVRNAPLLIRGGVILIGLAILFWKRKSLPKEFIFVTIWILFALFGVTLSERPYPHYLLQAVPALSLLLGILVTDKTLTQTLTVIPLVIAFFVPLYYKFWYYPTTPYYLNFIKFATGSINKDEYFASFNDKVSRNYRVARILTSITNKKDKVFVWGDTATIYALSKHLPPIRYVADYHINDFSSKEGVMKNLTNNYPKVIVRFNEGSPFPELKNLLDSNYILFADFEGAQIWKLDLPTVKSAIFP